MIQVFKLVFSNYKYVILAAIISLGLFFPLALISEYIFLEPYVISHIPSDRAGGFFLIVAISLMSGIVLSMNVFRIKALRNQTRKIGGSLFGSILGASAGACSCGPIGFAVISTFGSIGATATAFLANYEIPLRLAALAILVVTFYTTSKSLTVECKIKNKNL